MGQELSLSRAVLAPDWKLATAHDTCPEALRNEIAELEGTLPLRKVEPKLNGPLSETLADLLRPIGAKIDPRIGAEQALAWRSAMLMALSDLPPRVALHALRKAVHRPMKFLNEVEAVVREYAEEALDRQRNALHRLRMMRAEIDRATNQQPRIEAPAMEWTQESIDEANACFARVKSKIRYRLEGTEAITEQLDTEQKEAE